MRYHTPKSLLALSLLVTFSFAMTPPANAGSAFSAHTEGTATFSGTATLVHIDVAYDVLSSSPFALDTMALSADLDFSVVPYRFLNGEFTITAPSGDQIFGTFTGTAVEPPQLNSATFNGEFEFTGGTGQFLGVTGGGTFTGQETDTSPTEGVASADWSGEITAVPEPGALALLLSGALSGAALLLRHRAVPIGIKTTMRILGR